MTFVVVLAGLTVTTSSAGDLADPLLSRVGDEEVPGGVHRDAAGVVQFGGGGRTVIAAVARRSHCRRRW